MSLIFNAKTYTADSFAQNVLKYIGALKTVSVLDDLSLKRTAPKPTTVLSGVGHTQAKLERTVTLTGALTPSGVGRLSVDVDVPVGMASADIDSLCNDMGALVSSASFKLHVKNQQISF